MNTKKDKNTQAVVKNVFTGFLEEKGHVVATTNSGDGAIDMVQNDNYDIVFLDEPFSGLDPVIVKEISKILTYYKEEKNTSKSSGSWWDNLVRKSKEWLEGDMNDYD